MLKLLWVGLSLCIALSGCDRFNPSRLTIRNEGTTNAQDLTVFTDRGQKWVLGDLAPGTTLRFSKSIPGEGAVAVSYVSDGKRIQSLDCYYSQGGLNPANGVITITNDQIKRECQSD